MGAVRLRPGDLTVKARVFLAAYGKTGGLLKAAAIAGSSIQQHHTWLKDPAYVEAFEVAHKQSIEHLELEARRRGMDGVEEPIYQNGQLVGYKQRYSDALLMFLLKGLDKGKYAEHTTVEAKNVNVNANANLNVDLSRLTNDELRSLDGLLAKLAGADPNAAPAGPSGEGKT